MLTPLLFAVVAQVQTPKLIVVPAANLGVHEVRAAELLDSVAELARLDGFDATVSPRSCGDRACLLEVGREAQAHAVVSAGFAAVGHDAVMDLEGVDVTRAATLSRLTFTVRSTTRSDLVMEPIRFLRTLKVALLETPELPPAAKVEPKPVECPAPQLIVKEPEPPHPLAKLPFVTGAFGLAAAVSGGVLLSINAVEAESLSRAMVNGLVPYGRVEQAVAIDERNQAALGLFIGSAATFTLTAIIAWLVRS